MEEGQVAPGEKHKLWIKIRDFNRAYANENKTIRIKRAIRVAASVLIVVSLSCTLYLKLHVTEKQYTFSASNKNLGTGNTVLTFGNGERIEIDKKESMIAVLDHQSVQVDNDTIKKTKTQTAYPEKESAMNELLVPYGKKTTLVLDDGTKVWLNAGTKFAFPQKFTGKKRMVYLDGEGYFEVAENQSRPFVVSSTNINVEVLGTKFNMNSYSTDEQNETVLLEGSVVVWSEGKLIKDKVKISPNQRVVFSINDKNLNVLQEPDAGDYIAWIDGWYKFSNENLEQVLTKIGRYYNVAFKYDKTKILNALPISGKLDLKESFGEVMLTLSKVAKIEYEIDGGKVIIN